MHNGDLNPVLFKRAVVDLPAPVGVQDDERAFAAFLDGDGGEWANGHGTSFGKLLICSTVWPRRPLFSSAAISLMACAADQRFGNAES